MNNASEGIELTANIQLASEASTYALDTVQEDNKGNFYSAVNLAPGRPYILSVTNNGSTDLSSTTSVYARQYTETDGGSIGGANQSEAAELNIAAGEHWISYTAEEDGIYTFSVSEPSNYGYLYLYQLESSRLTQLPQDSSYGQYFSSGSTGKIANIILNKGDQVLVRIYQGNYQELTCSVQPSWAVWKFTLAEDNNNTQSITLNTSGEEGKVWLIFDNSITEGKYTISTGNNTYVTALKLYKDGEEVTQEGNTEEQQSNTVTFVYKPSENAVYQLGITTEDRSINISFTITKEPESETPDEGGDSGDSGDNSGEGGNTEGGSNTGSNE